MSEGAGEAVQEMLKNPEAVSALSQKIAQFISDSQQQMQ